MNEHAVFILKVFLNIKRNNKEYKQIKNRKVSFLAHSSDINNLLEGLNGVLKDWLD